MRMTACVGKKGGQEAKPRDWVSASRSLQPKKARRRTNGRTRPKRKENKDEGVQFYVTAY